MNFGPTHPMREKTLISMMNNLTEIIVAYPSFKNKILTQLTAKAFFKITSTSFFHLHQYSRRNRDFVTDIF